MKKTVRFTSEKSAKSFASRSKGEFRDLRDHDNRKSDFKVIVDTDNESTLDKIVRS